MRAVQVWVLAGFGLLLGFGLVGALREAELLPPFLAGLAILALPGLAAWTAQRFGPLARPGLAGILFGIACSLPLAVLGVRRFLELRAAEASCEAQGGFLCGYEALGASLFLIGPVVLAILLAGLCAVGAIVADQQRPLNREVASVP